MSTRTKEQLEEYLMVLCKKLTDESFYAEHLRNCIRTLEHEAKQNNNYEMADNLRLLCKNLANIQYNTETYSGQIYDLLELTFEDIYEKEERP